MGRGRQKAKQTKVARELKYHTSSIDVNALQRELTGGAVYQAPPPPVVDDDDDDDDPYCPVLQVRGGRRRRAGHSLSSPLDDDGPGRRVIGCSGQAQP